MNDLPMKNLEIDFTEIPRGWWLYSLSNNHAPIRFAGETHFEYSMKEHGHPSWTIALQRTEGGMLTTGSGDTPREALKSALLTIRKR